MPYLVLKKICHVPTAAPSLLQSGDEVFEEKWFATRAGCISSCTGSTGRIQWDAIPYTPDAGVLKNWSDLKKVSVSFIYISLKKICLVLI